MNKHRHGICILNCRLAGVGITGEVTRDVSEIAHTTRNHNFSYKEMSYIKKPVSTNIIKCKFNKN